MKIIRYIDYGIFHGGCMFAYNSTFEEIKTHLEAEAEEAWVLGLQDCEGLFNDKSAAFVTTHVVRIDETETTVDYFVIKNEDKIDESFYIMLAHECVHLCQFVLPRFLERDREIEAEAYFHTYIMTKILETIKGNYDD